MKLRRSMLLILMVAMASVFGAKASRAQSSSSPASSPATAVPTYLVGGYTVGSFPTGDWGKAAGFGLGLDGTDVLFRNPGRPIALRSSVGLLYNFSRTVSVPQSNLGPNSALSLETKNTSIYFGLGPEIGKTTGAVNPFVFGTVGVTTYWSSGTVTGTAGGSPYASKNGDSRISFMWSAGLGIRKKVSAKSMVELSGEFRSGGDHQFMTPDEITNNGTAVTANRKSRSTDQIIVRLGTVFGI